MKKKILAVASAGGHWTQLLRMIPAFDDHEVIFVSTKENFSEKVKGYAYYTIPDCNRLNKVGLVKSFFMVLRTVVKVRPDFIITTGAAPGLMAIVAGRLMGSQTLWIDSIANVETLSMSGKIAIRIANKVYTQWPDLARKRVFYYGSVLSV